jgi:hypothetical protein
MSKVTNYFKVFRIVPDFERRSGYRLDQHFFPFRDFDQVSVELAASAAARKMATLRHSGARPQISVLHDAPGFSVPVIGDFPEGSGAE